MTEVPDGFREAWASGLHVGAFRPRMQVFVRRGTFRRRFDTWDGPRIDAKVPGDKKGKEWQATWVPLTDYVQIPSVLQCDLSQTFDENGLSTATLQVENIVYSQQAGTMGMLYHLMDTGHLTPWRGYKPPGRVAPNVLSNDWYNMLVGDAQITVVQGYGTLGVKTFTGLLDDVDPTSKPARLTLTVRDFGKVLVEEHCWGRVNGPKILEPVIFTQKGALQGIGTAVGYNPKASSVRDGHPERYVLDSNESSTWMSTNREGQELTEWIQVRLPKGMYQSFVLRPHYDNMEMWVGVYAEDNLRGGEPCQVDDLNIHNGWIDIPDDEGGGVVPGDTNGGWKYIKHWQRIDKGKHEYRLDHKLELGEGSILRVGFRHLAKVAAGEYRAGVVRLQGVKRKSESALHLRRVGFNADASSGHDGEAGLAMHVTDNNRKTQWSSTTRGAEDLTEWIEIQVPQGLYRSFLVYTDDTDLEMYVGVYALPRARTKKNGDKVIYDAQVDDVDFAGGWVTAPDGGLVPGDSNGGWPYLKKFTGVGPQTRFKKAEKFEIGHKLEMGRGSRIRIGFRKLARKSHGHYNVSIGTFRAYTRSGVPENATVPKPTPKIEVGDPSDIVRIALKWAGFKEWEVENTGATLSSDWSFNRQNFLIDLITKVQEVTGFVFYMKPPSEPDQSIGIPVFRSSYLLRDDLPGLPTITSSQLLTDLQAKISDTQLSNIIRVRGAANKRGVTLQADATKRLMSVYSPPWTKDRRLAGVLKHVIHNEERLKDQKSLDVMARLIALKQALAATTATITIPGTPEFDLDWQVGVLDEVTGLATRLYLANTSSTFITGEQTSWTSTLGGALLDTPDIVRVKADLAAIAPPGKLISDLGSELG